MNRRGSFLQTLGPGILFASTAIGVSHLVQSTRAGAEYGFSLLIFVLLANILKYPFFEFGSRYANITGTSLLNGYQKQGRWILVAYAVITFVSMFTVVAAVSFVCSGLMIELFKISYDIIYVVFILFFICVAILFIGKYHVLDGLVKIVSVILLISTLSAFIFILINGREVQIEGFVPQDIYSDRGILFLIALMGWMPTAVDMSVWNSIWTVERIQQTNYKPLLKETLLDFNIGYIMTIILSICFITFGAFLMYGTGEVLPDSSADFANKLIDLYTQSLGLWSYFIIAIAAFCVMFSTTIAVFDGYSRSIEKTFSLLFNFKHSENTYLVCLFVIAIGAYIIIWKFIGSFKQLIDLATTVSFLIAPFCAVANYIVVNSSDIPIDKRPPYWLNLLAILGIVFLIGFSFLFCFFI